MTARYWKHHNLIDREENPPRRFFLAVAHGNHVRRITLLRLSRQ